MKRAEWYPAGVRDGGLIPTYRSWKAMKNRCLNPNGTDAVYYIHRGIKLCERWMLFENFLADMGPRPSAGHTIDRKENDGNYEPGNCRWATKLEQARNRRSNHIVEAFGESLCIKEWSLKMGISRERICQRIADGWESELAVSTPTQSRPYKRVHKK